MKSFLISLLILTLVFSTLGFSQEQNTQPTKAVVFGFQGLSNLSLGNFYNTVAFKHYYDTQSAFRGGVGFSSATNNGNTTSSYFVNGSLLFDYARTQNTLVYYGLGVSYSNANNSNESYSGNGIFGAEFNVLQNVSLGAEYNLTYTTSPAVEVTSWNLGSNGMLFLSVYF